ncbi:hypothetical protein K7X08_032012 [Anisodus acutangulus]|uniref:Inositol polyphosphate-related phosphatase domain-containing protein n=1 Tax=Anisodus acutangulus TaxID=402998 RepID=A0A9Q1MM74_9SOLA|nr:hypothetical protein K7X08_032012 [Anisodus acutangulus]
MAAVHGIYRERERERERRERTSISEWEHCTIKKSKTEKSTRAMEHLPRGSVNLDRPKIINVQNYRIFVSTWNVGGESPPNNLNLDECLHSSPPADIYVLGFQEIVPLNAGNILGAEDNGLAKKWIALIGQTLNSGPGTSGGNGCYTCSPVPDPITEWNADFEGSSRYKASSFSHRHQSFQTPQCGILENDPSILQPRMDGRYRGCDRVIFVHMSSDFDPNREQRPSDYSYAHRPSDFSSCRRPSDCSSFHRPNDYSSGHRLSDYSCGQRPSDVSRWGSSDDDYGPGDSPTVSFSHAEDGYRMPRNSTYCLAASKQMVGIFLTVWVRSDLREHVRNMKVLCVGRGLMGYLRNKGSISISMQLHQTSFFFVCTHLTSGQKEGDELRRNSDVMKILKKTRFLQVSGVGEEKSPETILGHE